MDYVNYWSNKNNYIDLMKKFIDGKINGIEFDQEFCQICKGGGRDNISKLDNPCNVELTKLKELKFPD